MSPTGRPEGESFERKREGGSVGPTGRPEGESFEREREGGSVSPMGRPEGESFEHERGERDANGQGPAARALLQPPEIACIDVRSASNNFYQCRMGRG